MHQSHESRRPVLDLVAREMPLDKPLFETPSRHRHLFVMILVACTMAFSTYLLLHTSLFLNHVEEKLRVGNGGDTAKIRLYNEQLASLQDRMTGFIAGSLETKLKTLEKSVAAGTVGAQEIRTFEELKNELKLLETYSAGKAGNLMDQARLEHQRFQLSPGSQQSVSDGDLMREVVQLKNLFYAGIASCGAMVVLIGGYWWQHNWREKRLQSDLPKSSLLAISQKDE